MVKDYAHDYAVTAFMFYAECGCPSDEELHEIIYRWAAKNHDSVEHRNKRRRRRLLTEEDLIREKAAQTEVELECYIADVAAVNQMLHEISKTSMGDDKIKCIGYVYFCRGINLKTRGNTSALVQRCVVETGMNESFIYRSLRAAREIFMLKRGLRNGTVSETAQKVFGFAT